MILEKKVLFLPRPKYRSLQVHKDNICEHKFSSQGIVGTRAPKETKFTGSLYVEWKS